jgi:hypothetical protein
MMDATPVNQPVPSTPNDPGKKDPRFQYHPFKDSLILALLVAIIVSIVLASFFLTPRSNNAYVEIRYGTTLLWDKDDTTKNTAIAFPTTGSKVLSYKDSDGPIFLGEGNYFEFYTDGSTEEPEVDVTLYSDHSIQITKQKSPRNVCAKIGRIYSEYTPLVCLPNSLEAVIKAGTGYPEWDN